MAKEESESSPIVLSSENLNLITNNLDPINFMGRTQFGKVYRGKIINRARDVTVKLLDKTALDLIHLDDAVALIHDEVKILSDPTLKHHPNLVKLIGYRVEGQQIGVVYDLDPLDTLHNMTLKDDFTWADRIKVALGIARLLDFLHSNKDPYVVFNLDPAHIILDQEYNPMLIEFGLLHGGSIGELSFQKSQIYMSPGYTDRCFMASGWIGTFCDVYVYGMLVLELIGKKTLDKEKVEPNTVLIDKWAKGEYKTKSSLVHDSLECEAADGILITDLAMRCIKYYPKDRLTMHQVVERLEHLVK